MNNLEQFITQILLHGFKGFKNMEYWEIEFFLHKNKWAKADPNKTNLEKKDIEIKKEETTNED